MPPPFGFPRHRAIVGITVLLVLALLATWQVSKSRTFQVAGDIVARVETTQPKVALTFDDGPSRKALQTLLPILASRQVKATFFVVGAELERHPALAQELIAAGHELGNHSFSHQRMIFKSKAFIAEEIERTDALIRQAGAPNEILFRPPYGIKGWTLPHYLADSHRPTIMWDVEPDSKRNQTHSSQAIVDTTLAQTRPGSIILLHVMYPRRRTSLEAVAPIIDSLQRQGYQFVTVSELLRLAPTPKAEPPPNP